MTTEGKKLNSVRNAPSLNALDYLKSLSFLPPNVERGIKKPSNGDLKRWFNMGAVIINGETPKAKNTISFPVWELVFFPKSKRKVTMVKERK